MPFYGGSAAAGYSDAVDADSQRQVRSAEVARLLQAISQQATTFQNQQQDRTRALDTRQGFGNMLYGLTPPGPAQTGPLPPAPGQPSVPSMPPASAPSPGALPSPPGASGAPAPAAAPNGPPAAAGGPGAPSLPPYRAVPEPQPGPDGTPGSIPPPPAAPPQPEVKLPSPMTFLAKIKAAGVDPGKAADYLDQYAPLYKAQQEQEFKQMQAELRAQQAAMTAYKTVMEAQERQLKDKREDRRLEQGDRRLDEQERRDERRAAQADRRENRLIGALSQRNSGAGASDFSNWTEEEKDKFAREASKDRTMLVGIGRGKQGPQNLMDINRRIINLDGGSGPGAAQRRQEFRADSNSLNKLTQTYDAITSFENTAVANGHALIDLAKKVDTTGVPVVERWIRAGRKAVKGDPDVSEFQAQLMLFGTEAAKILSNPSMSGVLTDSARKEVEAFLPQNASAEQIERVVKRLETDFTNRKSSNEKQMDAIRDRMTKGYSAGSKPGGQLPPTNDKGWKLEKDAKGNQAYVSPDRKQFEEVK